MAENPPISDDGIPLRVSDEMFVLERKDVEIEVKLENCKPWGKRSATGKLYMTTCRLVFVNDKFRNSDFKSFDIPLFNIFKEKFEQPIFGSNYLDIKVKPLYGLIPDIASVKLWFKSGGCHKFLKLFDVVIREVRQFRNKNQIRGFNQRVQNGQFANNAAYSDPSDPTLIFVTQPQQMMNQGQGNNYFQQAFQGQGQQLGTNNPGFIPTNPMQNPNQNPNQQYNPNQQFPPNQQYDPNYQQNLNQNQQYNPQMQQQQQQQQVNYNYPEQQQGQQNQQQQQPNQQQQQQQQQQQNNQNQQPDSGFYFGFFGPQLQNNRY